MAAFKVFLVLASILIITQPGYLSQACSLLDIKVNTTRIDVYRGVPEYQVTISNPCTCAQSNLLVRCFDIPSVEPIDPAILKVLGELCLVNNGRPIVQGKPIVFKYAFLQPTDLIPFSSRLLC